MDKTSYSKPALDYAQQIQQLKDRGLIIENEEKALHLLETISYFRLSSYWYPLIETPKENLIFKTDATFDKAFGLYCFDRELRKLVLAELEKIEIAIRAKMIYELSIIHDPFWFKNHDLFKNKESLQLSLEKLRDEIKKSDEVFIVNFSKNYINLFPPSWILLEVTSFGLLSHMYCNLKPGQTKRKIAHYFGLDDTTFESWLHCIVYLRNVCAHHSRLWNRVMRINPKISQNFKENFFITQHLDNRRLYVMLSMILYSLISVNHTNTFSDKVKCLLARNPNVDTRAMGFPEKWDNEPLWK